MYVLMSGDTVNSISTLVNPLRQLLVCFALVGFCYFLSTDFRLTLLFPCH